MIVREGKSDITAENGENFSIVYKLIRKELGNDICFDICVEMFSDEKNIQTESFAGVTENEMFAEFIFKKLVDYEVTIVSASYVIDDYFGEFERGKVLF